ncbi:YdeI family protein [Caenimonas terrae]|uniref:YdeI family protein n=1 Tax=Caenimonas terrae TaxID=696074 RepID=A0ABW0ND83_9BURK
MEDPILAFVSQQEWEAWLAQGASTSPGVWLRLAKAGAADKTLSYAEALESALCYGWIDGQKRAESDQHWLQRFTPRATRSIWSKINKEKAEALIASGRMRRAGLDEVERARQDGRWDAAYASARNATIPDDLQQALDASPAARAFFASLDSRNRYAVLFRIQNAKKPETRARKIAQFVAMLAAGERLHP